MLAFSSPSIERRESFLIVCSLAMLTSWPLTCEILYLRPTCMSQQHTKQVGCQTALINQHNTTTQALHLIIIIIIITTSPPFPFCSQLPYQLSNPDLPTRNKTHPSQVEESRNRSTPRVKNDTQATGYSRSNSKPYSR